MSCLTGPRSTGAGGAATLDRCEGACVRCVPGCVSALSQSPAPVQEAVPQLSLPGTLQQGTRGGRGRLPQHRMWDLSQLTHDAWINPFASAAHRRLMDGELESGSKR